MSKILIHSIVFSPDAVSTAYLYNDIALKLKEKGYEVVVLTTTPQYNVIENEIKKQPLKRKIYGVFYESSYFGIKVIHVSQKKYKSTLLRILGFIYWHIISFIIGVFEKKVDVILSPSPPLSIGLINIFLGKIKKCKVIYNVQEIYPDLLIEQKGLKSKSIISCLKWIERFVYNKSDAVTTIDKVFYDSICNRFDNKNKLHIIPNFVDTAIYKPISQVLSNLNSSYFPINNKSLKIMYAGNIGYAQDWETLLRVAIELRNNNVDFYIIGEGVMKDSLESEVAKNNLENVHIISYQPRELMPSLIAYSDLQFIFMSNKTDKQGFPSKVYTIMACSKPLIVCSSENTPIINFLESIHCAFLIKENNIDAKTKKVVDFIRNSSKDELIDMGKRGFDEVLKYYSKDSVTDKYIELIGSLTK
jgi:Glycosyltransferase